MNDLKAPKSPEGDFSPIGFAAQMQKEKELDEQIKTHKPRLVLSYE